MEKEFLNPEKILSKLELKEDFWVADFGSGSGFWVLPLAKKLTKGKVFAIDLLEEPLSALRKKLKDEKIENVELRRANVEKGTTIFDESLDIVLMTNLLFEVEDLEGVFKEAKRVLKKGGKILIVDWKETIQEGPEKKVSKEKIEKIAENMGFFKEEEFEASPFHFGLILVK